REFLSDIRACICMRDNPELEGKVLDGLSGRPPDSSSRYGLPFLGDNSFLIDRIEPLEAPPLAHWYCRVTHDGDAAIQPHTPRLPLGAARREMPRPRRALSAPDTHPSPAIPPPPGTLIAPPQARQPKSKTSKKGKAS